MIRPSKIRAVAVFELLSTVKRKSYLISTFGMPVFLLLYGLLISIPGYFAAQKDAELRIYGVIDDASVLGLGEGESVTRSPLPAEVESMLDAAGRSGRVDQMLAFGRIVFERFETVDEAREALVAEGIRGYYRIPESYLDDGALELYRRSSENPLSGSMAADQIRTLLRERLLEGRLPDEVAARVDKPVSKTETWVIESSGELSEFNQIATIARIAIPGAFAMFLFISLMMTNGYLLQATATEKENRVVEVLLSSTNPEEILAGKLLGLGAAGLLQMSVWFSMFVVAGLFFAGLLAAWGVELPWFAMAVAVALFVVAYFFLGSLSLATGSLGGNAKESQQWSSVWIILSVAPFMMMGILILEPHGILGRILTFIPFTAPLTVLMRLSIEPEGIALWEIGGALALMVVSTWFSIRLGARLFRVGLLLTGSGPKLREIWRQARLSE